MKIRENYVLRKVADSYVVLPMSEAAVRFDGMITLNESGAMLWRRLERGAELKDLVEVLTSEFDVTEQEAAEDVVAFLDLLRPTGCLEE